MKSNFDPGCVWTALQDTDGLESHKKALADAALALVQTAEGSLDAMVRNARTTHDDQFVVEVDEEEDAYIERLAVTALKTALAKMRAVRKSGG